MARAGMVEEAQLLFEKTLSYANHLGLFSEEIGARGELLGNFPASADSSWSDQRRAQPGPDSGLQLPQPYSRIENAMILPPAATPMYCLPSNS